MSRAMLPRVRAMKKSAIEAIATDWLSEMCPDCLVRPQPTPVAEFVEFEISDRFGVPFRVDDQLPPTVEAVVLPRVDGAEVVLSDAVYRQLTDGGRRARFTVAHELGHIALHAAEMHTHFIEDRVPGLYRRSEIPIYCDPEYQANVFAGSLLMPRNMLELAITQLGPSVEPLADLFQVSNAAMWIRLRNIGSRQVIESPVVATRGFDERSPMRSPVVVTLRPPS